MQRQSFEAQKRTSRTAGRPRSGRSSGALVGGVEGCHFAILLNESADALVVEHGNNALPHTSTMFIALLHAVLCLWSSNEVQLKQEVRGAWQ